MEISRVLDVSMEEMDAFIKQMVLQDIEHATNKKVKESQVGTGYKYQKQLKGRSGKEGKVSTRIEELTSGSYKASFVSAQGKNYLSYSYEEQADGKVNLRYLESYDASSKSKELNYQLMNFLYKRSNKKRINLMLTHIERLIQENRKPVV
ncbi:MAG: DUF3284 domain-containing protein [Erysipelotrichia bacterium]|nr:DUF3284 domain-containing protein [Erysipelotrichia bacterium]NCC55412.1 DUF3284 domain-containing protein [Erysipelotrichia bacterium]